MVDILLANDDITVLGPPETLEVLVDVGPSGTRGSQIFVGIGNPNSTSIGQTPLLNDMYINVSPGENYGYMYQYVSEPGGNTWIEILRISPTIYSQNYLATFTSGESSIVIPISNIVTVSGTPLAANNFSVRYSIAHEHPLASSMSIPALVGSGDNLVINLNAIEYDSSWQNLEGEVTVHLFISLVF